MKGREIMRELSLHILDIIQNSIAAEADLIKLIINEDIKNNFLVINIIDNGKGMDKSKKEMVTDPFVTSRTSRDVGLGLPLLKEAANRCQGEFEIDSVPRKGTEIKVRFKYDHIDRAPLGDIVGTIVSLLAMNPDLNFVYHHTVKDREFIFTTEEVKKRLGKVEVNHPRVLNWIEDYLRDSLKEIHGGEK